MPVAAMKMPFERDYSPTLPNLIHDAVARHGDNEFLVLDDQRLTFRDAERQSAAIAKGLLALGVGKGTRIGILMPNVPDWILAYFAAARAGALTVSLSTFFQAREIAWGVRFNDLDTLVISAEYINHKYLDRLEQALPGLADHSSTELYIPEFPYLRRIVVCGECDRPWAMRGLQSLVDAGKAKPQIDDAFLAQVEANIAPSDWLITICTSGTTSEPKSVVHTHGTAVRTVDMFTHYNTWRPTDKLWSGQAFFWIGGQNTGVLPALFVGFSIHFTHTPKPEEIVALVERDKITTLALWPAQAAGVRAHAEKVGADLSSLRRGLREQRDELGQPIPKSRQTSSFGMTETFGMHSIEKWDATAPAGKAGNWGRGMPGIERRVFDRETGKEVAPGEEGELYVRGSTLMDGYYKRERQDVFTRDNFFATGDLVSIDDDGWLFFHGRATEMIKTAGANVSPKEVETVLHTYPGVREALVFGVPDEVKGEIVAAVLIPHDGAELDVAEIRTRLKDDISGYKVPTEFAVMDFHDIPRTGSAKAIKRELVPVIEKQRK